MNTPSYPQTPEGLIALLRLHPDPVRYVVSLTARVTPESEKAGYMGRTAARLAAYDGAQTSSRLASHDAAHGASRAAAWGAARGAVIDSARNATWKVSWEAAWAFGALAEATVVLDLLPPHHAHVLAEAVLSYLPTTALPPVTLSQPN